jgi:hypothetical protein
MNLPMPCIGAHPGSGGEVMGMDEVDVAVDVACMSIDRTSNSKERMSEHD